MSSEGLKTIPIGWRMVRLGDVAEQCLGKMLDAQKNRGRPLPYLRNPNVRWFEVNTSNLQEMPFEDHEFERYGLREGDVVVCEGGEAGRAAIWDGRLPDVKFQKAIHRVRPGPDLFNRFLVYRLMADYQSGRLADYYTGATIKHLTGQDLSRYEIPLPPLAEQRRITEVLDRAEALRAKRRAALAQLDTLTQAIFLDLFGDPATNPKRWPRVPFAEVLTHIDSGRSPTCLDRPVSGNEWGVLKLGAVTWCEYDPSENKALPPGVEPNPGFEVKPGDLLFARKNTYELVAACALVRETPPRLLMSDLIFRFCLRQGSGMHASFLHQLLIYPTKRREVQKLAGGSAGSMPNISKARLQTTPIELPPLSLQHDFARRVAAVEKLKTAHRASLAELDALFAALQHRAFRGEL